MKPRGIILIAICFFATTLTASGQAQPPPQPKPGPPAGTPGKYPAAGTSAAAGNKSSGTTTSASSTTASSRLTFAVADFEVPPEFRAERADLGRRIADEFASSLRDHTTSQVVRTLIVLTADDLADASRTRALREELDVDVIVGGKLGESGKDLTVESVQAEDAKLLATSKSNIAGNDPSQRIGIWLTAGGPQADLTAFVMEVKPPAFLLAVGSNKEVPIEHAFLYLHAGDRVRCGTGGELAIRINGVFFRIEPSAKWFTVEATRESGPAKELLTDMSERILTDSKMNYKAVTTR